MSENNMALVSKCMDILCKQVGIVDAERFIYIMRSDTFDYTKWQREHYDMISPEELDNAFEKYSEEHRFGGNKAEII
ncbi:MAG: hypothetical protein II773_08875 [Oscillospiraceae bacterium]|nr:hypothetical protein [Oscillospiraceae bacterium]MBQ4311691.1 hypothetical protein [Oscillospiraceae bacterium]MCR5166001.1 hypothetical protein [Oscillospiraceae bacterium]